MNYLIRSKFILPILFFLPLAIANDEDIIKNLDFYENYEAFSSDDYEQMISEDQDELLKEEEESEDSNV